eukprot:g9487.t1
MCGRVLAAHQIAQAGMGGAIGTFGIKGWSKVISDCPREGCDGKMGPADPPYQFKANEDLLCCQQRCPALITASEAPMAVASACGLVIGYELQQRSKCQ